MKRRVLTASVICACLVGAAALAFVLLTRSSRIDPEQFALIDEGMTRAEVERVLGGPPRNECTTSAIVWTRRNGQRRSAEIEPGTLPRQFFADRDAVDRLEAVWMSDAGLIALGFDADGRVQEKYVSEVFVAERPWTNLPEAVLRRFQR